jgi:hypothetical protein
MPKITTYRYGKELAMKKVCQQSLHVDMEKNKP